MSPQVVKLVALCSFTLWLVHPAIAEAASACSSTQKQALIQTKALVPAAQTTPATVTTGDAIRIAETVNCRTAQSSRAIIQAAIKNPQPKNGQRQTRTGIYVVATPAANGVVWRIDVARTANALTKTRKPSQIIKLRSALNEARRGTIKAPIWSNDPTRRSYNSAYQARIAKILVNGKTPEQALGIATIKSGATPNNLRQHKSQALLDQLAAANNYAAAAQKSRNSDAIKASRAIAIQTYLGARRAANNGWSKISGKWWSSLSGHRTLTNRLNRLLKYHPHPLTQSVATKYTMQLRQPANVSYSALPNDAFYPWPRDGAFDQQKVGITTDKPGILNLQIYNEAGKLIQTIEQTTTPGATEVSWDGSSTDGTIQEKGKYRYAVRFKDRAGVSIRVPGLSAFEIARDEIAPSVKKASLRYLSGGTLGPRIVASWEVEEIHSPNVITRAVLVHKTIDSTIRTVLDNSAQTRSMRRQTKLARGTWQVTLEFEDGSGNIARHNAGEIKVS